MVRDFFSKLLSSEISSFVRISVTVASLYPEVVTQEVLGQGFTVYETHR